MASFPTHSVQLTWGTASGNVNVFGNNSGDDFLTNSDFPPGCDWNPMPGNLSLERLAIRASANAGTNFTFQPYKGIPAVAEGPSVVLLNGSQSAEGAVAVTVAAPSIVGDLSTEAFGWTGASAGGSINARTMWKYSLASPYDLYSIIASGFSTNNFFSSTATRYLGLNSPFSSTVEANVQTAIPVAGTFQYLLVVILMQDTSGDSNYTVNLMVNGSPVITASLTNSASPALDREIITPAVVSAGDLISFEFTTSGPVDIAHRGRVYAAVGFLPL